MASLIVAGDTSGSITISAPLVAGSNTLTLPAVTDTLAGIAATQTLTNKTLTSPVLTTPALGTVASGVISACTSTNMVLVTPNLGTPSALVGTNISGTSNALSSGVGVNQVYSAPTRALATTYTNSSTKSIMMVITSNGTGTGIVTIGGVNVGTVNSSYADTSSYIIPPGATYSVATFTGLVRWTELS